MHSGINRLRVTNRTPKPFYGPQLGMLAALRFWKMALWQPRKQRLVRGIGRTTHLMSRSEQLSPENSAASCAWRFSFTLEHDPKKCVAVFGKIMLKQESRAGCRFNEKSSRSRRALTSTK